MKKEKENEKTDCRPAPDKRINANVALCKCPSTHGVYGIRFEERRNDWVRTWAFKIDERKAKREGFDQTKMSGSMQPTPEYPGCPYCGSSDILLCPCGKISCGPDWDGKPRKETCPWCGTTSMCYFAERAEIQGGHL